ncbi:MAG TPA: aldehyde dehydrogenase family protein [Candidatus Baltobacteraceae bacterium]|nr:aldehyde dehydrogenase family protein [Candidatus Baltobacteraceae bacterium]
MSATSTTPTISGDTASAPAPYERIERQFIGGEWREGSGEKTLDDVDPYTGRTLFSVRSASADDVDAAYRAAREAQPAWTAMLPQERSAIVARAATILDARKAEVVDWLIREAGSARVKAELEVQLVRAGMLEAATYPARIEGRILPTGIPGKEGRVYRSPVGVVCVISPWNFPLQLTNRSVAPALACGNAVVVKPATDTPVTGGTLLAKIYEEAGVPKGVYNVVVGSGSEIGDAVVEHPIPRVVSFTGSTPVGQHIGELCGKHVKRVCLELGGNAPFVVLADADVERAVDAAVFGKFMHQGQICMAINRIVVDRAVYDEFLERFVERVRALRVGDPNDARTAIGPIVNDQQLKSVLENVEKVKASGARVALEGRAEGRVLSPIVLADVRNENAQEELFGPVALVIPVDGDEEALRVANDVPYGLSSSVFTRDLERGVRFAQRMEAGMTHVNDAPVNDEPNNPFGGEKESGIGRFGGEWAIREFTTDHWITLQHEPRRYPI